MARLISMLVAAAALAGCYSSSTTFTGDTSTDTHADTHADTPADTWPDTIPDTWPDTWPDVPPDGTPTCPAPDPYPDGPVVSFIIDGGPYPGHSIPGRSCRVESVVTESEGSTFITLICLLDPGMAEEHTIDIYTWPSIWIPVWEDMEVWFEYEVETPWWENRWFALSYPGSEWTILGGFDADYPNPPIFGTLFPPLWLSTTETSCPLEPGDCFDTQRQAVHVTYNEIPYDIFDSTNGWVGEWGDYSFVVDAAEAHLNFRCTDVPGSWYTGILYASGWD